VAWYSDIRPARSGSTITVIADVAETESALAVIVAWPSATALTNPDGLTVATATLLLDHETGNPAITCPNCSWTSATSPTESPALVSNAVSGVTVIDAGGGNWGSVGSSSHAGVAIVEKAAAMAIAGTSFGGARGDLRLAPSVGRMAHSPLRLPSTPGPAAKNNADEGNTYML